MSYNGSHRIIRWENPVIRYDLSSHVLYYELDIQTAVRTPDPGERPPNRVPSRFLVQSSIPAHGRSPLLPKIVLCESLCPVFALSGQFVPFFLPQEIHFFIFIF